MNALAKIAWRNVVRHRRRTVITALVMSAGIGVYIFFNSTMAGMDGLTIYNMIDLGDSTVKVQAKGYSDNPSASPYDYLVGDWPAAAESILAGDERVIAVAPRFKTFCTLSNYRDSIPVGLTVVDPVADAAVFKTAEYIQDGRWLDGNAYGVVMGSVLATELGLGVGDAVLVSAETADSNINADEYYITGLLNTPDPGINGGGLFMSFADGSRLLGRDGLATELDCKAARGATLAATMQESRSMAEKIGELQPHLAAADIATMAQGYLAMRNMKAKYSMIIILMVLAISGVGIVNTILMSVYSRVKEIGILLAYGMKAKEINRLFMLEGALIGAIGSVAGAILGAALTWYMVEVGIPMQALLGKVDMGGLPLAGTLYGEWSASSVITGVLFGLVVALISAGIPARMASRLKPCAALKFV